MAQTFRPAFKGKKTSKRIASIASRIASGGDFSISEARAAAAPPAEQSAFDL